MRHLAGPWESIFARRAPGILNSLPANVGQVLTTFHDEVERRALRNGVSLASFHMLKHQIPVYKESLKDAMSDARSLITEKQRVSPVYSKRKTVAPEGIVSFDSLNNGPG